jgi:hypothetical protein
MAAPLDGVGTGQPPTYVDVEQELLENKRSFRKSYTLTYCGTPHFMLFVAYYVNEMEMVGGGGMYYAWVNKNE